MAQAECARCDYPKAGSPRLVVAWLKVADEFLCDRCVKELGVEAWRKQRAAMSTDGEGSQ